MPTFSPAKFGTLDRDVVYRTVDGQPLALDIYYPDSGGPWKTLVFIHGGAWTEGDKDPLPVVPTTAGFLVVSINYRMYPAYRFPAMIEDVKCAIRYLRAHAALFNLDPERIALIGHSAGGHLAALAGLAGEEAGWDRGPFAELSSRVQAVVEMSGPTDLTRPFPDWMMVQKELVFGAEQWVSASPVTHVHASAPPFLIVHGDADPAVPVEQANLLYEALIRAGAPAELLTLHNAGHGLEPLAGEMRPSAEEMFGRIIGFLTHCLA